MRTRGVCRAPTSKGPDAFNHGRPRAPPAVWWDLNAREALGLDAEALRVRGRRARASRGRRQRPVVRSPWQVTRRSFSAPPSTHDQPRANTSGSMSLASSRASIGASTGSDSTFRVGAGADVAGVGNDSAGDEGPRGCARSSARCPWSRARPGPLTRGSEGSAQSPRGTQIGLFFELPRDVPERGRGLVFIAELMDGVEVRPEYAGTTICFSKRSSEA